MLLSLLDGRFAGLFYGAPTLMQQLPEIDSPTGHVPAAVLAQQQPTILRGLVSHWPMVQRAKQSSTAYLQYLQHHARPTPVHIFQGNANMRGRYAYNDTFTGFNFSKATSRFTDFIALLNTYQQEDTPPHSYMGSTQANTLLNDFDRHHTVSGIPPCDGRLWLGNASRVGAHYDIPDNIACVVAGNRKFTLFPTAQVNNLYVGPLDFTPAGQSFSLVDFHQPDLEQYPRFATALEHARVAELQPGDAIYIPSMWWHHVESASPVAGLINFWWNEHTANGVYPLHSLLHAFLGIRHLPAKQRQAWQHLFEHYVFDANTDVNSHIPEHAQGVLADLDEKAAQQLKAFLAAQLGKG